MSAGRFQLVHRGAQVHKRRQDIDLRAEMSAIYRDERLMRRAFSTCAPWCNRFGKKQHRGAEFKDRRQYKDMRAEMSARRHDRG
jgi:hypothetical protein